MTSLACARCGAPVSLPADLTAQDVECGFCKTRTPLPMDLLGVRLGEHRASLARSQQAAAQAAVQAQGAATTRKVTSFVMWIVIVSLAVPLLITAGVLVFVYSVT